MFNQEKRINVGRCNGCTQRCQLGVRFVVLYDNYTAFRPTINGKIITQYHDKKNRKHYVTTYNNQSIALSYAYSAAKNCPKYKTPRTEEFIPNIQTHCQGCEYKCRLVAKLVQTETQTGYVPSIENKTIQNYINKRGIIRHVPVYNKAIKVFKKANQICKLCDKYRHNHVQQ